MTHSITSQKTLDFTGVTQHQIVVPGYEPFYTSDYGSAYVGDSLELMRTLPDGSVNLVLTSPPYALHFKKEYGNVDKGEYLDWFFPFAEQIYRLLPDDGSFVLNIGGS